ncbi:MAG: GxxExxY protein [Bacteroidia bacterium]|nr:GxxExxY protein [Bacteroidia bacterium]
MLLHEDITDKIISVFYKVYSTLGYGFLEKVYENALLFEFQKQEINAIAQFPIEVFYNGQKAGQYFADIIIESLVIIEVKTAEHIAKEHEFQLINYLKATELEVGLLLNFGEKPEFRRKIFTNDRKQIR